MNQASGHYPRKLIRLVLQTEDTPQNRQAVNRVLGQVRAATNTLEGHGVLKLEEVTLADGYVSRPAPGTPGTQSTS